MYIVEGYNEFKDDVLTIWDDTIKLFGLTISTSNINEVDIENNLCRINLSLDVDQRVCYLFQNPKSNEIFHEMYLYIFFGIELDRNLVGGEDYPLTTEEWVNYYAEDDFRSICLVDLPIIRDEILSNFKSLLEGDFSFEKDYLEWKPWYEKESEEGVDRRELSFEHYQASQV